MTRPVGFEHLMGMDTYITVPEQPSMSQQSSGLKRSYQMAMAPMNHPLLGQQFNIYAQAGTVPFPYPSSGLEPVAFFPDGEPYFYLSGERKRCRNACKACWERKSRCTMLKCGSCLNCVERNRECIPREHLRNRQPETAPNSNAPGAAAAPEGAEATDDAPSDDDACIAPATTNSFGISGSPNMPIPNKESPAASIDHGSAQGSLSSFYFAQTPASGQSGHPLSMPRPSPCLPLLRNHVASQVLPMPRQALHPASMIPAASPPILGSEHRSAVSTLSLPIPGALSPNQQFLAMPHNFSPSTTNSINAMTPQTHAVTPINAVSPMVMPFTSSSPLYMMQGQPTDLCGAAAQQYTSGQSMLYGSPQQYMPAGALHPHPTQPFQAAQRQYQQLSSRPLPPSHEFQPEQQALLRSMDPMFLQRIGSGQ
mmetsp:Transcript_25670/g.77987  ORF Transcript_25670/g.77987 Transcript_25670/m.77987 type:complete len:424 (-) Transcript_25670:747-2018(-)